ncbi:MAG: universal stress protein [Promethearchaeota archaeon]
MFKKILIGVDDSKDSYNAAKISIELAKMLNANITFLYVITDEYIKKIFGGEKKIEKSETQIDDFLLEQSRTKEIGEKVFNEIKNIAKQKLNEKQYEMIIRKGHPINEFLDELKSKNYDVVILGRTGASKAQKMVFGDLSKSVINETNITCVIVGNINN